MSMAMAAPRMLCDIPGFVSVLPCRQQNTLAACATFPSPSPSTLFRNSLSCSSPPSPCFSPSLCAFGCASSSAVDGVSGIGSVSSVATDPQFTASFVQRGSDSVCPLRGSSASSRRCLDDLSTCRLRTPSSRSLRIGRRVATAAGASCRAALERARGVTRTDGGRYRALSWTTSLRLESGGGKRPRGRSAIVCSACDSTSAQPDKSKGAAEEKPHNGGNEDRSSVQGQCDPLSNDCLVEAGTVIVQDDLNLLLQILPVDMRDKLLEHERRAELLEVILDLGRRPQARFLGDGGGEYLREEEVTREDLLAAQGAVGEFGGDNRAGVEGTLHRISAIRNRTGEIVGLTCRVGRAVSGHTDMLQELLDCGKSVLFLGRPGVGKTTVIREMARVLADVFHKRVVIVDTSNEIGGDGDVPHPAIGSARRMQVADPSVQHRVMVEAVENHMPEVVIVDEIGTEAEALACRTIAERGVQLVGTAHGQMLENLIKNPTLCDLVGGIHTVTLGDEEARVRGTQKSVLERKGPPTFPLLIEMRERNYWVTLQTDRSVDALLQGRRPTVETRSRDSEFNVVIERRLYDSCGNGKNSGKSVEFAEDGRATSSASWPTVTGKNASTSSLPSMVGVPVRPRDKGKESLMDDLTTYEWARRIGYVPDKDAIAERQRAAGVPRSDWYDLSKGGSGWDGEEDEGRSSFKTSGTWGGGERGQTPGKRGSRRGPRGNMTGANKHSQRRG